MAAICSTKLTYDPNGNTTVDDQGHHLNRQVLRSRLQTILAAPRGH